MRTIRMTALAVLLVATAAGCSSGGSDPGVGTWRASGGSDAPYLELAEDGALSGTDGCNRLMGTWTEKDDTIDFGQTASTLMACEGVDTWLSGLSTATVSGSEMTVRDESGATIGTLHKDG